METATHLSEPLFRLGATVISASQALVALGALAALLVLLLIAALIRGSASRSEAAERAREADLRAAEIMRAQSEMRGSIEAMANLFGARQAELNQAIGSRLDLLTGRLGQGIAEQTRSTHESLAKLQERLAVIDAAQGNIQSLAGQIGQLQSILSNKQTRGAFGQSRMETIVADGLPHGAYEFQATLTNNSRPDCLIRMPNGAPSLVIDAKFPLEAWNAIRAASDSGLAADAQRAAQAFRRDIEVHIMAIAEKYLIAGETQDTAFLFVPSESIFAEIHENHESLVHKAQRARIVIVSPSLLMLSIQVIQALLKDARMREQAHLIQGEVMRLMEDVGRLDERVRKLQGHFMQVGKDVDDILVSSSKVRKRGDRIGAYELGGGTAGGEEERPSLAADRPVRWAESRTGQLRLKVVEDDPDER